VHLVEIVAERDGRLRADRLRERLRGDERVAVAVAADPRAHAQERRQQRGRRRLDAKVAREVGVQARHLGEERVAVVRGPFSIVDDLQARQAQQRGLQAEHAAAQLALARRRFLGRQRTRSLDQNTAISRSRMLLRCLGRVRREHWRDALAAPAGDRLAARRRARRRDAAASVPRGGASPASASSRRRRCWLTSSAMFARCEK
jgi:hypothetical protein